MAFGQAKTQGFNSPSISTYQVSSIVLNKLGLFIYVGVPAAGNPPVFWMSESSVDSFGNAITPGVFSGQPGNPQVGLVLSTLAGILRFPVPGGLKDYGAMYAAGTELLQIGPQDSVGQDRILILETAGNGSTSANWFGIYVDGNANENVQMAMGYQGLTLNVITTFNAVLPGTGTSPTNPAQIESWHNMTLASGFTAGGQTPQYMLMPGGIVRLRGSVSLTGTHASGTQFWAVPTGYKPSVNQSFAGPTSLSGYAAGNISATVTNTSLQTGASGVSGNFITLDNMSYLLN